MGLEQPGIQMDAAIHGVKTELGEQYDAYGESYANAMTGMYGNAYNAGGMQSYGDEGVVQHQYDQTGTGDRFVDTSNQVFMDADRLALLEQEFHEQVTIGVVGTNVHMC